MNGKYIRVLYIGLKYDYGMSKLGYSFEFVNIFETLARMDKLQIHLFPFDEIMRNNGRAAMNNQLIEAVNELKPDCCVFVLFTDEIMKQTIKTISEKSGSITYNWFGDDHWRFNNYSKYWAPLFHWVSTTDNMSVDKYLKMGYQNIIKTQWGFNHHRYHSFDVWKDHEVTFIGQIHSHRNRVIHKLKQDGINVECWGKNWEAGRLSQDEMIRMYSRSKINLNFTESSVSLRWKPIVKVFLNRRADGSLQINSALQMIQNIRVLTTERRSQIKGRNFEIPGSGGFLLTQDADNLDEYFIPGKEIAVFSGINDLKEKIRYYLSNDKERENIRLAGYKRAIRDHTYEKRFLHIFQTMGLLSKI